MHNELTDNQWKQMIGNIYSMKDNQSLQILVLGTEHMLTEKGYLIMSECVRNNCLCYYNNEKGIFLN